MSILPGLLLVPLPRGFYVSPAARDSRLWPTRDRVFCLGRPSEHARYIVGVAVLVPARVREVRRAVGLIPVWIRVRPEAQRVFAHPALNRGHVPTARGAAGRVVVPFQTRVRVVEDPI